SPRILKISAKSIRSKERSSSLPRLGLPRTRQNASTLAMVNSLLRAVIGLPPHSQREAPFTLLELNCSILNARELPTMELLTGLQRIDLFPVLHYGHSLIGTAQHTFEDKGRQVLFGDEQLEYFPLLSRGLGGKQSALGMVTELPLGQQLTYHLQDLHPIGILNGHRMELQGFGLGRFLCLWFDRNLWSGDCHHRRSRAPSLPVVFLQYLFRNLQVTFQPIEHNQVELSIHETAHTGHYQADQPPGSIGRDVFNGYKTHPFAAELGFQPLLTGKHQGVADKLVAIACCPSNQIQRLLQGQVVEHKTDLALHGRIYQHVVAAQLAQNLQHFHQRRPAKLHVHQLRGENRRTKNH